MRQWINLMEATRKPTDPTAQAQAVYELALKVAKNLARTNFDFRKGWDQTWAKAITADMQTERKQHDASEKEESDYQAEEGKSHTPRPFDVAFALTAVTEKWWQNTAREESEKVVSDANYSYEDYQDGHPRVEQSDEMSALYDQLEMAKKIYYKGSDSIEGMTAILNAIDTYVDNLDRYTYHDTMTQSAEDFIKKIIPAILTICRAMQTRSK